MEEVDVEAVYLEVEERRRETETQRTLLSLYTNPLLTVSRVNSWKERKARKSSEGTTVANLNSSGSTAISETETGKTSQEVLHNEIISSKTMYNTEEATVVVEMQKCNRNLPEIQVQEVKYQSMLEIPLPKGTILSKVVKVTLETPSSPDTGASLSEPVKKKKLNGNAIEKSPLVRNEGNGQNGKTKRQSPAQTKTCVATTLENDSLILNYSGETYNKPPPTPNYVPGDSGKGDWEGYDGPHFLEGPNLSPAAPN